MATPPDFTNGTPLDASSLNRAGMWKIIPTGGSNVTIDSTGTVTPTGSPTGLLISGVFNADYDNYMMVMSGLTCSTNSIGLQMYLGTYTGTDFYGNLNYWNWGNGTMNNLPWANTGYAYLGIGDAYQCTNFTCHILNPYKAGVRTMYSAQGHGGTNAYHSEGITSVYTQYTSITLFVSSGTMSGGQIRFYGLRN